MLVTAESLAMLNELNGRLRNVAASFMLNGAFSHALHVFVLAITDRHAPSRKKRVHSAFCSTIRIVHGACRHFSCLNFHSSSNRAALSLHLHIAHCRCQHITECRHISANKPSPRCCHAGYMPPWFALTSLAPLAGAQPAAPGGIGMYSADAAIAALHAMPLMTAAAMAQGAPLRLPALCTA